jgi:DNA repair photolyase
MPLIKSKGNMYDWVTHMHTHLRGECPHHCKYCYVQTNPYGVSPKYKGEPRLLEEELKVSYGSNKIIFIEHMNDMFADGILPNWIDEIIEHCKRYPLNQYVFQTKNPLRASVYTTRFPKNSLIGTTIETNRTIFISKAPEPINRYLGMRDFTKRSFNIFVTIEPIMDFDVDILSEWMIDLKPSFVNIGADSKHCGLPEPSPEKIRALITALQKAKVPIKKKINLKRLGF